MRITTIDTRDLLKRKNELEELKEDMENIKDEMETLGWTPDSPRDDNGPFYLIWDSFDMAQAKFGPDEKEELAELEELESEISDFRHGATLILESDFEEYAQELADDLGLLNAAGWPYTCIDWEQAAKELAQDYTSVSYQNQDYYVRA